MKKNIAITALCLLSIYLVFFNNPSYSDYSGCVSAERLERTDRLLFPMEVNKATSIAYDICKIKYPESFTTKSKPLIDEEVSQCRKEKLQRLWSEKELARESGDRQKASQIEMDIISLEYSYMANGWKC